MSDPLAPLRAEIAAAQAQRQPVAERVQRLDDRLAVCRALRAERDRLAAEHGERIAAAVEAGDPSPHPSHELVRADHQAAEAERSEPATQSRRDALAEELQSHDLRLSQLQQDFAEAAWAAVPSAATRAIKLS